MDEAKIQKQYMELKAIDDQIKSVEKELSTVNSQLAEVEQIKTWILDLENYKNSECLIPLSNGIFVKAKLSENDTFLMNVGGNVCVPKSVKESVELLNSQGEQLQNYHNKLSSRLSVLDGMAQKIEKEFLDEEKNNS